MARKKDATEIVSYIRGLMEKHGPKRDGNTGAGYYSSYGIDLYDWEHFFDSIALCYFGNDELPINGLRMFLRDQQEGGFICRHIHGTGELRETPVVLRDDQEFARIWREHPELDQAWSELESEEHCKPFLTQVALMISRARGSASWLTRDDLDRLLAYLEFWLTECDRDHNGLSEWSSAPHSGADTQLARAGTWGSRYCEGVDLNCYLYRECLAASKVTAAVGMKDKSTHYLEKAAQKKQLINSLLWDEKECFYLDRDIRSGKRIEVKTAATLLPLWAGIASESQAALVVKRHLLNPEEFWTACPVPAYSRSQEGFTQHYMPPEGMDYVHGLLPDHGNWNGGMWPHWNYLIVHGLWDYGYRKEAKQIAAAQLKSMSDERGPFEWYNSDTGEGLGAHPFWPGASILGAILSTELDEDFDPVCIRDVSEPLDFSPVRARLGIKGAFASGPTR